LSQSVKDLGDRMSRRVGAGDEIVHAAIAFTREQGKSEQAGDRVMGRPRQHEQETIKSFVPVQRIF